MFLTLLLVTFVLSFAVSAIVVRIFTAPLQSILQRIIADEISSAWLRYMKFAIMVVGISAGVRIRELEKYITPMRSEKEARIIELTGDRWILEIYRTVIESLQGIAWMLLVFFVFALIAYVIVQITDFRKRAPDPPRS